GSLGYTFAAMALQEIEGQPRVVALLEAALSTGRLHHAFLFTGPPGVGKERAARAFAKALLCQGKEAGLDGCESCRRAQRGSHPDVSVVQPAADTGGASREIRVQQIRELCAALQLRPALGERKVALVLGAERMNAVAQNALLKTLEEPPSQTILILVSVGDQAILPTIRSRCLRVGFGPLPVEILARQLEAEGSPPAEAKLRASLSRGDGGLARELDARELARRAGRATRLLELAAKPDSEAASLLALTLADELSERADALAALRDAALVWRDLLVSSGGGGAELLVVAPALPALAPALAKAALTIDPPRLLRGLEALREAIAAIDGNGQPRLQLEAAFLRLAEAA
ncbi:MAG: DNA polymerase III subunit delta', partial [Deltaproteobacteria bacterium]